MVASAVLIAETVPLKVMLASLVPSPVVKVRPVIEAKEITPFETPKVTVWL